MKYLPSAEINLDSVKEGLRLNIDPRRPNTLYDAEDSFLENNEARFQLFEGCFYDYAFNYSNIVFGDIGDNILQPLKRNPHLGIIAPNIFVGTIEIPILEKDSDKKIGYLELEVQSIKSGYRDDYRDMLEFITEKCTDLLMQSSSPVSQHFDIDYTKDSQTLYQRFAFIKSVIGTDEFSEAVHRILSAPVTRWTEISEFKDIRNAKRFSNANIKEILKGGNRARLPETHFLKNQGIDSLPERINTIRKTDSVDTSENRFVKHALEVFVKFCNDINKRAIESKHLRMVNESEFLIGELESYLHHANFKEISRPTTLNINSPVLQRKEGYREVLRVWLMFDLAARLIWQGGDDVYKGGKKDIATLYEYWLFFKLLDLFQNMFRINPADVSELIKETDDGLNLQIRQGKHTALRGVFDSGIRKLNIRFSYNRSFGGKKTYPDSGSWSTTLRPDYTLSVWPLGISEAEAEKEELIVHIHFDAKYKVAGFFEILESKNEDELDEEKTQNRKGIYKNADLLKMHAYKDAIRRTGGAYVLYPGVKPIKQKGFHEIIPGLGAFPVRPSKTETGITELKAFINEVIDHFLNRASQRERHSFRTFDIHKTPPDENNILKEPIPESYNANRSLLPDETFVLVGFYNSAKQYEWIEKNNLYNFRMGTGAGSLVLDNETVAAKYLLLHTTGDNKSGDFWKIKSKGPKIFSKEDMLRKGYPTDPKDYYLIIEVEKVTDSEFRNVKWDFKKLKNYATGRGSAYPFTASLSELMKSVIR